MEKMWGLLVHLGMNMWSDRKMDETLAFEIDVWDDIVEACVANGLNTIVLDLGEGVQYASHPELAKPGAWTREEVRRQVKRLQAKGIALIPKLNFSACHDAWLGDYGRMLSTPTYYRVCRELISEVYGLFDAPKYIHLGMDEEDYDMQQEMDLVVIRQGELIWNDLQFLCDCVRDTGATPWIWADLYMDVTEEFRTRISNEDIVLSPWNYNAIRPEHYTPIETRPDEALRYAGRNYSYIEEVPFCTNFMEKSPLLANEGYKIVPCTSNFFNCAFNIPDMVEYFKEIAPGGNLLGHITAPWLRTTKSYWDSINKEIRMLGEARDRFYSDL